MRRRCQIAAEKTRHNRNGVTGWMGFRLMRVAPEGAFDLPRHGNYVHGRYSEACRQSMKQVRMLVAVINGRLPPDVLAAMPRAAGWARFPNGLTAPDRGAPNRAEVIASKLRDNEPLAFMTMLARMV